MEFKNEIIGDVAIVHVYLNRATLTKAVKFKDTVLSVLDSGKTKLIVDLTACEYIDSTFLGAMVSSLKKANSLNGDLRLVYNKEVPSLMFVLTRMDKVFQVFPDVDEAIRSFTGAKPTLDWL